MVYKSTYLKLMSASAIIVWLMISYIFLAYYTSVISSNVQSSCAPTPSSEEPLMWRSFKFINWKVTKFTAKWTWVITGGIRKINFLQNQRLCQSFVYLTILSWTMIWITTTAVHYMWLLEIEINICGMSHYCIGIHMWLIHMLLYLLPKALIWHTVTWFKLRCPN
jgi:hypothetical protein